MEDIITSIIYSITTTLWAINGALAGLLLASLVLVREFQKIRRRKLNSLTSRFLPGYNRRTLSAFSSVG